MMNSRKLLETALEQLDVLGYKLEELGITDKVNRHNCLAFLFAEQQRLKGELDSLNARVATRKAQLERIKHQAENLATGGLNTVLAPFKSTLSMIQSRLH